MTMPADAQARRLMDLLYDLALSANSTPPEALYADLETAIDAWYSGDGNVGLGWETELYDAIVQLAKAVEWEPPR